MVTGFCGLSSYGVTSGYFSYPSFVLSGYGVTYALNGYPIRGFELLGASYALNGYPILGLELRWGIMRYHPELLAHYRADNNFHRVQRVPILRFQFMSILLQFGVKLER